LAQAPVIASPPISRAPSPSCFEKWSRHECSAGGVGVARREIVERSRSRALHISLAVLLLFSVGGAVAAAPLRGHTRPTGSPSPERARLR